MEVETNAMPEDEGVIIGHKICQTRDAEWLCIENIYQKVNRPNFYDIGGTYIEDVADYWFMLKTEQFSNTYLVHIFVCNRQECQFTISLSGHLQNMKVDKKNNIVYLTRSMKEYKFEKKKEMSQNYLTTYSFTNFDIDIMKDNQIFIAVSFSNNCRAMYQSVIENVKLKHDYRHLLKDPALSDFTIESADGETFKVHKSLLAVSSEVFKAMLKEETAESQNNYVKLVDVSKDDLKFIVECIYTGTIKDVENCNFVNMLMLADRFNLKALRELSQYALGQQLTIENALEILVVADMYNSDVLKMSVLQFFKKNASNIEPGYFKDIKSVELMRQLCEHMIPT